MRSVLIIGLFWAATAHGAPTWTVLPLESRGVDAEAAETFRDLLISEIGARNRARFVNAPGACSDVPCARTAGKSLGANVAVFGKLAKLGANIVITATAVEVRDGRVLSQQRMSVSRVEDLEPAAGRIAVAIVSGKQVEQTAQLGMITTKEVAADRRREGHRGPSFRLGGGGLLGEADTAGAAIRFDLGYWYEARHFALEPFVSWRMAAEDPGQAFGLNFDIAAYYIPGLGDATPFVGAGGGVHWVGQTRTVRAQAGQVISLEAESERSESGWGPGAFTRLGVLFFRTYSVRMTVSVDYEVSFVGLFDDGPTQAINGGIGVLF